MQLGPDDDIGVFTIYRWDHNFRQTHRIEGVPLVSKSLNTKTKVSMAFHGFSMGFPKTIISFCFLRVIRQFLIAQLFCSSASDPNSSHSWTADDQDCEL
jgi:hypothetical protein